MFSKLMDKDFKKVEPLFGSLAHYVTLKSIFAGLTPGELFVDDVVAPKTAVIAFNSRVYLAGDPTATKPELVNQFFRDTFIPAMQEKGEDAFVLSPTPAWQSVMPTVLDGLHPISRKRQYYRQDVRQRDWQPRLPDGYTLRPVDADLLADTSLINLDFVTEEMVSERPSIADFLAKSFGYSVIYDNEVVGWCMSEYNCGTRCEIGIATEDAHQRKGLATALGTAVIQHALTVGIHDIGWDCWADNEASVATALKLGFELAKETAVSLIFTSTTIALGVQGNIQFEKEHFAAASKLYESAIELGGVPGWIYWNDACANSYLKQTDAVFKNLYLAADHGFTNVEMITASKHFKHLHETAVWDTYIQHLKAQQGQKN